MRCLHPGKTRNICEVCSFPQEDCICSRHQYVERISACFIYKMPTVKTVFKLKFRARPDIAKGIAQVMFISLSERNMLSDADAITFVPMSRFSEFRRGYNQSRLIARHLSSLTGIPCVPYLRKFGSTVSQHSLDRTGRTGNLLGMFEPDKKYEKDIKDKKIIIVDDVSTTGSTFNEIAKTLLIFGAGSCYASAFCVTKKAKKH